MKSLIRLQVGAFGGIGNSVDILHQMFCTCDNPVSEQVGDSVKICKNCGGRVLSC